MAENPAYAVSSEGRVINLQIGCHLVPRWGAKRQSLVVSIVPLGGRSRDVPIHRLVASAFIPNPEELPVVLHTDGDLANNAARNLSWSARAGATRRESRRMNQETLQKVLASALFSSRSEERWALLTPASPYAISSEGRVLNIHEALLQRQGLDEDGFPVVRLWRGAGAELVRVHELVAAVHLQKPTATAVLQLRDGNPTHIWAGNLVWSPSPADH